MVENFNPEKPAKNSSEFERLKRMNKNLILISIVVAGLVFADLLISVNQGKPAISKVKQQTVSQTEVVNKAINDINEKILKEKATAVLTGSSEENGLYKIKFKIGDNEMESYLTLNGKLLFPNVIDLGETSAGEEKAVSGEIPKRDAPDVKLFVMSFCPYGNQAEELMMPVEKLLGGKANIGLHYVIYSNYQGGPKWCLDKENKYCSLHGIQELNQDIRELCVQKYQKDKLWDFVKEINKTSTAQNVDSNWENAARKVGIDIERIKNCQRNEALQILEEELALNKKYGIQGSPQLVINDAEYQGDRSSEAYKVGICSGFNEPPQECGQVLSSQSGSVSGGCK